jgi:hypothetical protein
MIPKGVAFLTVLVCRREARNVLAATVAARINIDIPPTARFFSMPPRPRL